MRLQLIHEKVQESENDDNLFSEFRPTGGPTVQPTPATVLLPLPVKGVYFAPTHPVTDLDNK